MGDGFEDLDLDRLRRRRSSALLAGIVDRMATAAGG